MTASRLLPLSLFLLAALPARATDDLIHVPAVKGPHGGVLKKSGEFEIEVKLESGKPESGKTEKALRIWLLEGKGRKPAVKDSVLRVKFRSRSRETHKRTERTLECAPRSEAGQDSFACPVSFDPPRRAKLVITASRGGRGGEAQFRWPLEAPAP